MILSSLDLVKFQSCKRKWLLEKSWRVLKIHPRALFAKILRQAVYELSKAKDPEEVVSRAKVAYMTVAANPGLDAAGNTYQIATDYVAALCTVIVAISRTTIPVLKYPPQIKLSTHIQWQPISFMDDAGGLHQWLICDSLDDDQKARFAHGWNTMADMVLLDAPVTLHIVCIGSLRNGRLHSPWCRGYKHPVIHNRVRLQKPDGTPLAGQQWKPVWLSDLNYSPSQWVDIMTADNVTPLLLRHLAITQVSPAACDQIRLEISEVAREIAAATLPGVMGGMQLPMNRAACDSPVICSMQPACYRDNPSADISRLGLYQIRTQGQPASRAHVLLQSDGAGSPHSRNSEPSPIVAS